MHILGAIALMGGTIFMRFALVPSSGEIDDETRRQLQERVRSRWSKVVMISAALLLISGIANLGLAARYNFNGFVNYNMLAGIKFILALPIFYFASVLSGRSATAQKFQANANFWLNLNLVLALLMVLIGGLLRFTPRTLKDRAADQTPPAVSATVDLSSSEAAE
jgi:uncharacterized membrane protein